nr:nucleolar protein [Hymenolepis microstoma]
MLSAYMFYKPQKGKMPVEIDAEFRNTIEMLTEVSKRIKLEPSSNLLISPPPTQTKKSVPISKSRQKGEVMKLNRTRKRVPSPEKINAKRPRMSNVSTKGEGSIQNESESIPDLVDGSVVEDEVINSLDLGGHLFNFLIYPISMTAFAKDFYGLKPYHSTGGKKRCNLNLILPIQKLDILVTTNRLYFGKDIELINGSSNFTGRAYRSRIWSEFADGASARFLLPERYFIKFGVEMGLLQEIINGPIYSVVNFVSTSFTGSLIDFTSHNCPPGDVFIIVLENTLTIKVTSLQGVVGNGATKIEGAEMSYKMRTGDLLYLPSFYAHEVELEEGCEHAIVLCIVNRTPVLIREWGTKLLRAMNMSQALTQKDLFRELLEFTRNSEAHFSDLYIDLNSPGKIFDGVSKWLIGQDVKFTEKDRKIVSGAITELQKEFMRKSPSMWLHFSERNYHITTYGSYWQDPNYESGHEEEETVGVLQMRPNRPRLGGNPYLEDLELDLRSCVRIARRSAVCVVDDPNDPQHICLYHTFENSIDARDENEFSSLKLPHNDINLSMVRRLVNYYPQSVIINELARESEEEKTNLVHELFNDGIIIATSLWQQDMFDENEEESEEVGDEDEGVPNETGHFDEEDDNPACDMIDLDDDDSTVDIEEFV